MLKTEELKNLVEDSNKKLAKIIIQEEHPEATKLQSPEARQNQIIHQLEDHQKQLEQKMHDGLKAAIYALDECQNPVMNKNEVVEYLYKSFDILDSGEAFSQLGQALLTNKSWKDHLGITGPCMDALYQGAKHIFDNKDYKKAEQAFYVLCALDPTQTNYWTGLGHSSFQDKNYEQAINAYSMVSMLNPDDIRPHVWAANTFEQTKDIDHAKMALDSAMELARKNKTADRELIHYIENKIYNLKAA